jgi:hypothetical protein
MVRMSSVCQRDRQTERGRSRQRGTRQTDGETGKREEGQINRRRDRQTDRWWAGKQD